jgi:predicted ATP-grasp superfamily ATP-dependent carboligase
VIVCDDGPSNWLRQPDRSTSAFAATLVIAPECDGLLVSLLQQLQCDTWQDVLNLNVPWSMAEIFADKFRTQSWLQSNGLTTPQTKTLSDHAANALQATHQVAPFEDSNAFDEIGKQSTEFAVIKPRDGVGSDRVSLVPMSHESFQRLPEFYGEHDRWVIQPFVRGVACSIGFLGGGATDATLILPPAEQDIQWIEGRLQYCGGRIPCEPSLEPAVKSIADRLVYALGPFHGYIGADIVVNADDPQNVNAHVIEINPRLCTSYVGYRTFAAENLAARFVPGGSQRPVLWKTSGVQFGVDGKLFDSETAFR